MSRAKLNHSALMAGSIVLMTAGIGMSIGAGDQEPARAEQKAVMPKKHFAVIENYCLDCHDAETKKGKVNLEDLSFDITSDIPTAELWQDVLDVINEGEMPPEKKEQIPSDEKAAFLRDLSVQMVNARNILSDSGGDITMRRLNRREYQNTLEALLGFRPDVSELPDDSGTGGFDTSGASLFLSSDQFEQYRATATRALTYALFDRRRPKRSTVRYETEKISAEIVELSKQHLANFERAKAFYAQDKKPVQEFGFRDLAHAKKQLSRAKQHYDALMHYHVERPESKTGVVVRWVKNASPIRYRTSFAGGTYKIRIRAGHYEDVPERRRYLKYSFFGSKTDMRELGHVKITGTIANPEVVEFEAKVPDGVRGSFDFEQRNYGDAPSRYFIDNQWKQKNGIGEPAALWIDYVEIEGPFFEDKSPSVVRQIVRGRAEGESDEAYARKTITEFATQAFREKKPDPEFVEKLVARYLGKREKGAGSKAAMIDSFALLLSSPSFIYLIEPRGEQGGEKPVRLSDRELAIRLSYFLWSAPPDAQLMAAARSGALSDSKTLKAETARLLADPRADRFISSFAHQWLDMTRLDMFEFSSKYHPEFDDAVRNSARREVYATIRHLLDEELPIETLLKTDFVVVNDILADFYGLSGVKGPGFRKVSIDESSPRGGLLGAAAIHIMGSDGQRSSPVERGVWVLRHLLNDPPPPAPPNVPMLEHEDEVLPIRELQKRHQEEPQCASCHRQIDPIGYGLENFTAAGLWREVEQVEVADPKQTVQQKRRNAPKLKAFPIDPSGKLPSGEDFGGYHDLRDAILAGHRDSFARAFTENLIAYALGRPYGISDDNLAAEITTEVAKRGNTISAFIHTLVGSDSFQLK